MKEVNRQSNPPYQSTFESFLKPYSAVVTQKEDKNSIDCQ
jgi:hypothetical protein